MRQCDGMKVTENGEFKPCNSENVTHIDDKGFIYCKPHGENRQRHRNCRKLRANELNRIKAGKTIQKY